MIEFQVWDQREGRMYTWEEILSSPFWSVATLFATPDRYILRQYIDRLDRNKQEIYEGDIVLLQGHRGLIVWDYPNDGWRIALPHQMWLSSHDMVIIGNQWQNPDQVPDLSDGEG